ncbi:MAG: NAD(P)-dependent oxidoreductase [Fimbriimonadales bacterium]|nr:NAD(P)-dependent oxidoreductase [Fimbriimonadales bacterium]
MSCRVGFVGLGVMGGPMAGHLLAKGFDLTVWNRTASKTRPLAEAGARVAESLEALGAACDAVVLCVNRTEDVRECLERLAPALARGSLAIDHSTISPVAAREFQARLRAEGIGFVDAPVTGGSMGAQKGQLTVFCGGEEDDVRRALPIVGAYARRAERVGGPGSGQMMKMANQIAVAGSLLGLCEALAFARKAGLDLGQTVELVGSGAAGSWAFQNYGPKILAEDWSPGFSIDNQLKDFAYCEEAAKAVGAAIPGTELVERLLADLRDQGLGGQTTAALYRRLLQLGSDS